jgi:signal transduction histidine kinase/CheY-like chemotaxis protein
VPGDYIQISSGLGEAPPLNIVVLPVIFDGQVKAVIELASFHAFSAIHQLFLDQLTESIGVVLNMITASMRTEKLLAQSQNLTQELLSQSNELTAQQAELKGSNAVLEKQALELEEKARLLVDQNAKVEVKNQEVELARVSLEEKAEQLALASKYKSEFLANMSHELRTPLNSLLILASLLAENGESNLTAKQVEFAQTIYTSGGDLLTLINEILDLSKVESGKMEIDPRAIPLDELREFVERSFRPIADHKALTLDVELSAELPATIRTDPLRLEQVLKNLLANAFKFTTRGGIALKVGPPAPGTRFHRDVLNETAKVIAFTVSDTGIGIPPEKHQIIFEAFQQADGTTSRKYGGTGLGLSISREITRLLGGEIQVASVAGKGSIFTLYLPQTYPGPELGLDEASVESQRPSARDARTSGPPTTHPVASQPIEDDRASVAPGDRVLLVIEDDLRFARIMVDMARQNGFKVIAVDRGDAGLALANEIQPDAIALDIQLPVLDGWSVLERLKRNPRTRHIPVHVISIVERSQRVFGRGAFAYLQKPVSKAALEDAFQRIATFLDRKVKVLLIVEDDDQQRQRIVALLGEGDDVKITAVRTTEEAVKELEAGTFDCLVVDLVLPGQSGFDLIEEVKTQPRYRDLPVIIYTAKELSDGEEARAKKYAHSVIVKTGVASTQRLVEDTSLFLHRMDSSAPGRGAQAPGQGPDERSLAGKTVLVVDDDVRNIFAMSSILESRGLKVVYAENGKAGVDALAANPGIDVVLMDVMMPGMDGYDTIRTIRANPTHQSLPIIAVTAKALKDDRKKCMDAGASDYLPKPVDVSRLLGLLATWTRPA